MPTVVVVIEEDIAMRALIGEWLAADAYEVHGESPGKVAAPPRADLVIVDLPNLRASDAAHLRAVQARHPGAALIGLSTQLGRSLPSGASAARRLGVTRLLAKPCTREELLGAVAATLAA